MNIDQTFDNPGLRIGVVNGEILLVVEVDLGAHFMEAILSFGAGGARKLAAELLAEAEKLDAANV